MANLGLDINYSNLTVESVQQIVKDIKSGYDNLVNNILTLDSSQYTWKNLCKPFLVLSDTFASRSSVFEMSSFHTNSDVRTACSNAETEITNYFVELNMRKDLYQVYKTYYNDKFILENHQGETKKYMDDKMTDYKLNGLDLEESSYLKVKEIQMRLTELCNKIQLNINNENSVFMFDLSQLDGMQPEYLASRITDSGQYKITLKYPDFFGIMEYCKVRETRKKMLTAFSNKCAENNIPMVLEILKLRKELANILGYVQYSDMVLAKKMAKNTETVMNFLNSLKLKAKKSCQNDVQKLSELAVSLGDSIDQIELWDTAYYSRIYKEQNAGLSEDYLRQHFPLDVVTSGMFNIYQTLLGLEFREVTNEHKQKLWHEDVQLFEVTDSKFGNLVGHFYLDLFPRDGKYGHAAVFTFVNKSSSNLPVASMICNFEKGSNLKFSEVVTFFHEFGHTMHNICSNTQIGQFGGTNCERDFVEMPSQMLEEWCYRPASLKIMSQGITDETIEKINIKRNMLEGYFNARQLCFGLYDMTLHSTYFDTISNSSNPSDALAMLYSDIISEATGLRAIPGTNMIASFSHLFGGYASGYYGYMWSKVYSKDVFVSKFLDHELDPIVGAEYRKEILSFGGSRPSIESLRIFLGREPSDEPFIQSFDA